MEARPVGESTSAPRTNTPTPESIEITPLPALSPRTPSANIGESDPVTRPTSTPDARPVDGLLPTAHRPPVSNGDGGTLLPRTVTVQAAGSESEVLAQAKAHAGNGSSPEASPLVSGAAHRPDGSRPAERPLERVSLSPTNPVVPVGESQLPPAKPLAEFQLPPSPKPLSRVSAEGGEFQLPPAARPQGDFQLPGARPAMPVTNELQLPVARTGGSGEFQLPAAARPVAPGVQGDGSQLANNIKQQGPADTGSGTGSLGVPPITTLISTDNVTGRPPAGPVPAGHPGDGIKEMDRCLVPGVNTGGSPTRSIGGHPAPRAGEQSGIRITPAGNQSVAGAFGELEFKPAVGGTVGTNIGGYINRPSAPTPAEPTIIANGGGRHLPADSTNGSGLGERVEVMRPPAPLLVSLQQVASSPRPGESGVAQQAPPGVVQTDNIAHLLPGQYRPGTTSPSGDFFALPAAVRKDPPSIGSDVLQTITTVSGGTPKPGPLAEICLVSNGPSQNPVFRTEQEIALQRRLQQQEGVPSPSNLARVAPSDQTQTILTTLVNISKNTDAMQLPPASRPSQEQQSELRRLLNNEVVPTVAARNDRHDSGDVCLVVPSARKEEIKPARERATEFVVRLHDMLNSREPFVARDTVKQVDADLIRVRPADLAQWTAPREIERVAERVSDRISSDIASRVQLETLPFASSNLRPALELARASTTIANASAIESLKLADVIGRTGIDAQAMRVPSDKAIDSRLPINSVNDAGRSAQVVASNFPADRIGNLPAAGIAEDGQAIPGRTADGRIIPGVTADGRIVLADGRILLSSEVRSADGRQIQTVLPDGRSVLTDGRILMPDGKIIAPDGKAVATNQTAGLTFDPKATDGRPSTVEAQAADKGGKNIVMDPVLGPVRIIVTASGETIMVPVDQTLAAPDKTSDRKDVIDKKTDKKTDKEKEEEDKEKELAALIAKKKERKPEPKDEVKPDDKTNKQQPLQQRRKYLVRTGDTVESVASDQLGDQRYSVLICIINRAVIRFDWEGAKSTAKLRVGQIIWLPSPAEMQVHRAMFFKNAAPAGAGKFGANTEEQTPGQETVDLEEMKLPEVQLTDSDTTALIEKVQTALQTVNLAPAINKPLPPVAKPLQGMSSVPAKIEGRPSVRVSAPEFNKADSENDLALAERNWKLLSNRVADAVAVVRDSKLSNVTETIQQQMLIERMATVIADCTATPGNTVSFLPGALRNTNDNQSVPTEVLMTVQRANCICRVVTVENPEAKSFSTRLQISNNATEWSTVASYECTEKSAVRYLNKGNGTVDTFTLRLPVTVVRNMASQDLIRNWESYVTSYGR